MKSKTGLFIICVSALVVAGWFGIYPRQKTSSLLITSDIHLSAPGGRWPHTTVDYRSFINSMNDHPDLLFIVGDFVDNVVLKNGKPSPGGRDHWKSEVSIFNDINRTLTDTIVLHTYGAGHDFIESVSLEFAETNTGVPENGHRRWQNVDLIWFTVRPAVFRNTGSNPPALTQAGYQWLDTVLKQSHNAILLWHVPIRTPNTERLGQWPGDTNLTIPPSDQLYRLLDRHRSRIVAIFNGHIHKPLKTNYKDIPVFLCPFYKTHCRCLIRQTSDAIHITPEQCRLPGLRVRLNQIPE